MMNTVQFSCYVLIVSSIMIGEKCNLLKLSRRAVVNATVQATNSTINTNPVITKCKDNKWVFHKSKCYRVFNTFEYFTSANTICQNNGATLASIGDPAENRIIQEIVRTDTRYTEAWIGLRVIPPGKEYTWVDQTPRVYSNWLFERPNDEGRCVHIIPGGYWSNTLCYRKLQFVCKREVVTVKKDGKTKLIIMITLPLSCVVIMLVFISYLCFRSHAEIKSLRVDEKKISQHFVDVVANNATVTPHNNGVKGAYEEKLRECAEAMKSEEEKDGGYEERRKRQRLSPEERGKMYKQVTFV